MSNTHDEKEQDLDQWLSKVNSDYQAKVKSIEDAKWYKRISVALFTVLALILFSAAYMDTNLKEYVNGIVSMSVQFLIMCIAIVTVIVTFLGKMFKKFNNKLDDKHNKQLEQLKNQDDSLSSSIIAINEHSKLKTKFLIFYMVFIIAIGMILGLLINELVTYMQSTYQIAILGFTLLVVCLPFATNEFVKGVLLHKEYKKYRIELDAVIDASQRQLTIGKN